MKRVLISGGLGFIGSNFIQFLLEEIGDVQGIPIHITNIDKKTYAGRGKNLENMKLAEDPRYEFIEGDIADKKTVSEVLKDREFDYVFHFAAESHVDRSWTDSSPFRKTNVEGTGTLLKHLLELSDCGLQKIIHISTDEVYGSREEGSFTEKDELNPTNPYSKSKMEAEVLAQHYHKAYDLPIIITRSSNNYGPYQFPEKLLPLFITNLIEGKKVPLMWSEENPGLNVRDWLHVRDNCRAIWYLAQYGEVGEVYNIAGENEKTNIEMTKILLDYFGYGEEMIEKVPHRQAHDFRYSINCDKLKELGFKHQHTNLKKEVQDVCRWYQDNPQWWKPLK